MWYHRNIINKFLTVIQQHLPHEEITFWWLLKASNEIIYDFLKEITDWITKLSSILTFHKNKWGETGLKYFTQ